MAPEIRFDGKEKVLSLGKYPYVSLSSARQLRLEARTLLAQQVDPGAAGKEKARKRPKTFEAVARAWHANREDGLDPAHAQRVIARMERDVFPSLGARSLDAITAPEILELVRAVEARGALDVSRRLKQGIGQVFRFAIASGWAKEDPTVPLAGALKPKPRVQHMARLPMTEFPNLVRAIVDYDGEENGRRREITRDSVMFTLLTWARTGETRFAKWTEFENLEGADPIWRIGAERMKMGREHLVPLSRQTAALLARRRRATDSDWVFPGLKAGQPISQNTMIYACYRMGFRGRQTIHGFRGLASTWANEAECYRSDWVEMALAHTDEDEVRGAYNSALYLSPRRRMLQDWADLIDRSASRDRPDAPAAPAGDEQARLKATRRRASSKKDDVPGLPYWQQTRSLRLSPARTVRKDG